MWVPWRWDLLLLGEQEVMETKERRGQSVYAMFTYTEWLGSEIHMQP